MSATALWCDHGHLMKVVSIFSIFVKAKSRQDFKSVVSSVTTCFVRKVLFVKLRNDMFSWYI